MTSKTYPQNLLYDLLDCYDPIMNRIDQTTKIATRHKNQKRIDEVYHNNQQLIDSMITTTLMNMPERTSNILYNRYKNGQTLVQAAEHLNISASRTQQVQYTAIHRWGIGSETLLYFSIFWPEQQTKMPLDLQITATSWLLFLLKSFDTTALFGTLEYSSKAYDYLINGLHAGTILEEKLEVYDVLTFLDVMHATFLDATNNHLKHDNINKSNNK